MNKTSRSWAVRLLYLYACIALIPQCLAATVLLCPSHNVNVSPQKCTGFITPYSLTLFFSKRSETLVHSLSGGFNGLNFRVRIVESTEPTKSQQDYADEMGFDVTDKAKRAGKNGDHILHKGQHIFMNSYVDLLPEGDNPQHVFLTADTAKQSVAVNTGVTAAEVEIDSMV